MGTLYLGVDLHVRTQTSAGWTPPMGNSISASSISNATRCPTNPAVRQAAAEERPAGRRAVAGTVAERRFSHGASAERGQPGSVAAVARAGTAGAAHAGGSSDECGARRRRAGTVLSPAAGETQSARSGPCGRGAQAGVAAVPYAAREEGLPRVPEPGSRRRRARFAMSCAGTAARLSK